MLKISVIIPTFNRAHTLKRAIDSVLCQTYAPHEIIVIDDGSTDNTSELLTHYQNLKVIKTENQGVSLARNLGIQAASGEWIAFLDSDDEWLPFKLQKQVAMIEDRPHLKLIHSDEMWIRKDVRVNPHKKHQKGGGDQYLPSLLMCMISPSATIMQRETLFELGLFDESYPCCEDYDLWLKFTSLYPVGFINEMLIKKYGGHPDQLSQKYQAMDYWRVKSLAWILQHRSLSEEKEQATRDVLKKKCEILLQGYEKHGNKHEHYHHVLAFYQSWIS
jgi:glycosyltransferase involved in cell wall biosynthesis